MIDTYTAEKIIKTWFNSDSQIDDLTTALKEAAEAEEMSPDRYFSEILQFCKNRCEGSKEAAIFFKEPNMFMKDAKFEIEKDHCIYKTVSKVIESIIEKKPYQEEQQGWLVTPYLEESPTMKKVKQIIRAKMRP